MDIQKFNKKLAGMIKDAKRIEREDVARARRLWLKIAEYCVEVAKTPGLEPAFAAMIRNKSRALVDRAEGLIARMPDERGEAAGAKRARARGVARNSSRPGVPPTAREGTPRGQASARPDEGRGQGDAGDDTRGPSEKTGAKGENAGGEAGNLAGSEPKDEPGEEPGDDTSLKALGRPPPGFKEVKPRDYHGESIIPKKGASSGYNPAEARDMDFSELKIVGAEDFPAVPPGAARDARAGKKKDPFADTAGLEPPANASEGTCFACGAPNPRGSKYCLQCGTPLDEDEGT